MQSTGIAGIATIITQILISKLQLNNAYFAILFPAITGLLTIDYKLPAMWYTHLQEISSYTIGLCIVGIIFYYLRDTIINFIKRIFDKEDQFTIAEIFTPSEILRFSSFLNLQSTVVEGKFNMCIGSPEFIAHSFVNEDKIQAEFRSYSNNYYGARGSSVTFANTTLGYKGTVEWKIRQTKTSQAVKECKIDRNFTFNYMHVKIQSIDNKKICFLKFRDAVDKCLEETSKTFTTQGYKFISNRDFVVTPVLECTKDEKAEIGKLLIDSFFHPSKDRIWNICSKIHTNPKFFMSMGQIPVCGWLLYGPPGTGKSSLPFRIAAALGRDIISLDIRMFKTKRDAYTIMMEPSNSTPIRVLGQKDKYVYVFDEFDAGILWLAAREKKRTEKREFINRKIQKYLSPSESLEDLEDLESLASAASADSKEAKDSKSKKLDPTISEDETDFCIKDLLELLQGVIPLSGSIMFATTNHFDKIKEICPALVRDGRLTPVEFGYPSEETIQEISQYFWGKKLRIHISPYHTVSTSTIILKATTLKVMDGNFEQFETEIRELFST